MKKRYKLIKSKDRDAYQIKALVDMPEHGVRKSELGGFVTSAKNLPQNGTGWIQYPAMVLGNAVVEMGLIAGDSVISGHSTIRCTEIKESEIKGCLIDGDVKIENSTLEICDIMSNGTIKNSRLKWLKFQTEFDVLNSEIQATKEAISFKAKTIFKEVVLSMSKGVFKGDLHWTNVKSIREYPMKTFRVFVPTTLKNVKIGIDCEKMIIGSEHKSENVDSHHVKIIGATDTVFLDTKWFSIVKSHIEGDICLKGRLAIKNSIIKGFVTIDWDGTIRQSNLSEMVSVHRDKYKRVILEDVEASGEIELVS